MNEEWTKKTNRLIKICLDLANVLDDAGNRSPDFANPTPEFQRVQWLSKQLGLGYRALSDYLRKGSIEIIKLQSDYHRAVENMQLARMSRERMEDFQEQIFGDRNAECFNDEIKSKIREAVKRIDEEWLRENTDGEE